MIPHGITDKNERANDRKCTFRLMEIDFRMIAHGSAEWKAAVLLREDILRKPLGSYFTEEELEAEKDHVQVAGFSKGEVLATAVLVPEGDQLKMQRVAVQESLQGSGIGSGMMAFCEQYALKAGVSRIYCHARDSAVAFYLKNKYEEQGAYFLEDGIPHVKMVKIMR